MKGKHRFGHLFTLLALVVTLTSTQTAYAATCYSTTSGNWDSAFDCGSPTTGDDVVIQDGHTITIPSGAGTQTVANLTVDSGGTLKLEDAVKSNGTFDLNGTLEMAGGAVDSTGSAPTYDPSSSLIYNTSGSSDVAHEWGTGTSGVGVPQNVEIKNGTTLNLNVTGSPNRTVQGSLSIQGTLSPEGVLLSTAGTLNVGGNFGGSGHFTHQDGTVNFNGTSPQTITHSRGGTDKRFNNLTINSTVTANFSIDLVGDLTVTTGNSFSMSNWSLEFELNSAKNLDCDGSCSFNNLIVRTVDASSSAQSVDVNGNFTIRTSGSTFTAPSNMSVAGNWDNNGSFTDNSSTVSFDGSEAQSIQGATTFHNLSIVNSSADTDGVTIDSSQTVNGTLTLTDGLLKVGSNNLILGTNASISGASSTSMIVTDSDGSETDDGFLCKQFTDGTDSDLAAFTFTIGDSSGTTDYSPATLNFDEVDLSSAEVCVRVTDGKHANSDASSNFITRYWTVDANTGVTNIDHIDVTFDYIDADISGTENDIYSAYHNGSTWTPTGEAADTVNNELEGTDLIMSSANIQGGIDFSGGESNSSLPVTLAFFKATSVGQTNQMIRFDWQSATELGNVGFNLYVESETGLLPLNNQLIPSAVIDSVSPQSYRYQAKDLLGNIFYLEEVDIVGNTRQHGPFKLGQAYGSPVQLESIDWQAIRAQHEAQAAQRQATFLAQAQTVVDQVRHQPGIEQTAHVSSHQPSSQTLLSEVASLYDLYFPLISLPAADNEALLNLHVNQDGLYRVTYEQLVAAGFDLADVPVEQIALVNQGNPVPIELSERSEGTTFGPGSYIEFYGQRVDSLYTDNNIYSLSLDSTTTRKSRTRPASHFSMPAWPTCSTQAAHGALSDTDTCGTSFSMTQRTQSPFYLETITVERNREYSFAAPNGDPWYDSRLLAYTTPVSATFEVPVDAYQAGSSPVTLTVNLWGGTDWPQESPDHHVVLQFNGENVADLLFNGIESHTMQTQLPADLLQEGTNTLTVLLPGDSGVRWDLVMLEGYSLTYPRAFEAQADQLTFTAAGDQFTVSGFTQADVVVYRLIDNTPMRLEQVQVSPINGIDRGIDGTYSATFPGTETPATYLLSTIDALQQPTIMPARPEPDMTSGRAEYLIISHADFLSGIEPLAQFHRERGLSVQVVDVEDVYAHFSHGIVDAQAIQDYINYAAQQKGTQYVLLVGGDTYDYHDYLAEGSISFIPSLYAATDPTLVKFAPVDPLYTDLNDDNIPDLPIGRFPVRTAAELETLVAKTLAYGSKDYERTALFAADTSDGLLSSFASHSDTFVTQLPAEWDVTRVYLDQVEVDEARHMLLETLNDGVALTSFLGHSGLTHWSFENLFTSNDAEKLLNRGRPTVINQWGCWNTYYVTPEYNTLGHKLLLSGDKGAAAVLGAATLTQSASDRALGTLLTPKLVQPGVTLGDAIQAAKRELVSQRERKADKNAQTPRPQSDVLLGWTLLGDPALVITSE